MASLLSVYQGALGYSTSIPLSLLPIIPALESAHAVSYATKLAGTLSKDKIIIVNLSGRGDKDVAQVKAMLKD